MKKVYLHIEKVFEKLVSFAIVMLGSSITFIVAMCLVVFWLTNKKFYQQDIHDSVGDVILGITFLCLFIIQKSSNRFSAALHLKINELVASHDKASNHVIHTAGKTEDELQKLAAEYEELADEKRKESKGK